MNTVLSSSIDGPLRVNGQALVRKTILEERIKYLRFYGSKILQVRIGQEYYLQTLINELISALEYATNVEELYLQQQYGDKEQNIKTLNYCLANLKTIKSLELQQVTAFEQEQVNLLKGLTQLKSLDLEFSEENKSSEQKHLFEALPSLESLQSLRLFITSGAVKALDENFVSSFPILPQLKELSLTIEKHKINDKQFKVLQDKIFQYKNLEALKLSFMDSEVTDKCLATFFVQIKKVGFNLQKFHFVSSSKADEGIFKNMKAFLATQKQLQTLEISGLLFKDKLLEAFNSVLICQKSLKNITIDIYKNSLRNAGLSEIAANLIKLKELEEVKILFDGSNYSGESVIEIGEAFKSLKSLRDLRIEFPGKVRDDIIDEFAERIAQCVKLNYLYVFFSGSGHHNVAEFLSQTPTSTIFENPYLNMTHKSSYQKFKTGFFNYFLFSLVIANRFTNIQHYEFSTNTMYSAHSQFLNKVDKYTKSLHEKCAQLKSLRYKAKYYWAQTGKDFEKLIVANANTLVSIINTQDYGGYLVHLENKSNILEIDFTAIHLEQLDNLLSKFPKLVYLNIGRNIQFTQLKESFIEQLIESDVILELLPLQAQTNNLVDVLTPCMILRKSALYIIIAYRKYIQEHLIYQQDLSHLDLWMEYNN